MKKIINLFVGTILIALGVMLWSFGWVVAIFTKAYKHLTRPKLTPKQTPWADHHEAITKDKEQSQ
jgi:hypothetical protein